ncbi:MAG TPA: hypothetical protein VNP98_16155 [Chthoniobacterales bacterium]|nr:hypothetical protein [Chthoniobacterales bacterium]
MNKPEQKFNRDLAANAFRSGPTGDHDTGAYLSRGAMSPRSNE